MWTTFSIPVQLVCQLVMPGNSAVVNTTTDSPISMPLTALPDGYIAFPDLGEAYKFHTTLVTWNTARKSCIEEGGNLAVVDSMKKHKYIAKMNTWSLEGPHVGIHRFYDNNEWTSVKTGLPLEAVLWAPEVVVANMKNQTNLECVSLWFLGVGADRCDFLRPYVCEIAIPRIESENPATNSYYDYK